MSYTYVTPHLRTPHLLSPPQRHFTVGPPSDRQHSSASSSTPNSPICATTTTTNNTTFTDHRRHQNLYRTFTPSTTITASSSNNNSNHIYNNDNNSNNNNNNNNNSNNKNNKYNKYNKNNKNKNKESELSIISTTRRNRRPSLYSHRNPQKHTRAILNAAQSGNASLIISSVDAAIADNYILNAVNYTTIASGYVRCKLPRQAFDTLAIMRANNLIPTPATLRVACSASLLIPYVQRYDAVSSLYESLRWSIRAGSTPCIRTWNMCMHCLIQKDGIDEVIKLLKNDNTTNKKYPEWDACSFNQVINSLGRSGRLCDALSIFGRMVTLTNIRPDVVTFNSILDAAASFHGRLPCTSISVNGDICFVNSVLSCMNRRRVKTDILTETLVLRVLSRCVPAEKQTRQLPQAIRYHINRVLFFPEENLKVDKVYFDAALTSLGLVGDINMVNKVFSKMIGHKTENENFMKLDILTMRALLTTARIKGDITLAKVILESSKSLNLKPDEKAYTTAIATCARTQPPDNNSAYDMLQQVLNEGIKWSAPMINAAISSHGHNLKSAISLWKNLRSQALVSNNSSAVNDRMVYDSLFRVCGRCCSPRDALRIWYAAKTAGHMSPNTFESRAVFNAFIRGLGESDTLHGRQNVEDNVLKKNYLRILRTECGNISDSDIDWPIERIRIKW